MNLNPFARRREQRDALDALTLALMGAGTATASGVRVNQDSALASVAVAACIEVRAETFSALPGGVYRKIDRQREQVLDHPVQRLLFERPNDLMTSGELLRWKQMRQDITGNAYVRVVWRGGRPTELWPMYGANPEVKTSGGKIAYRYQGDDITPGGDYPAADVLQFKGPFLKNPLEAESPIQLIRDTIGLSIASEQFFGRFLNNGTHFPIYAETDTVLKEEDIKAVQKSLSLTSGVGSAGTMRIFDRGLKVRQNNMSLKDADLSAQMRWYLEQICRLYRVPLPLVQDWTHGTYTNSEQAGLWFAQHTITPIAVDTERVVRKLFITGEEDLYCKWNLDAVLRGDYTTRTQGYSTLINAGVLSPNEARAFEDMDPYEGGDQYRLPLNTENAAAAANLPAPAPAPKRDTASAPDQAQRSILQPVLDDAIERIKTRAAQDKERGRDNDTTRHFAIDTVMPAVRSAYEAAGLDLDIDTLIDGLLGD